MPGKRQVEPSLTATGTRVRELLAGDRVSWHQHDADQLVYPARGVLSVLTEHTVWVLPSPGHGAYLPAGIRHAHRAHRRTTLQSLLLPPGTRTAADGRPQVLPVSPLLRELLAVLTGSAPAPEPRQRLLAVVADELAAEAPPALALPRPADPRLAAAARVLRADPTADLATLAAAARVSDRTLSRLVGDQLGLTVPHWRTQYRLAASLLWLTDGETVTATAHRCGWRNASGYIAAFRAAFGVTPRTYQRSL